MPKKLPSPSPLYGRSLLSLSTITAHELHLLLHYASFLKQRSQPYSPLLSGKSVVLLFEKPSTRTRLSFEAALAEEGGRAIALPIAETHIGQRETIADSARTISQLCSAVAYRGYSHATITQFSAHLQVPLYNALSNLWHPTQALADLLTIVEYWGTLQDIRVAFLGDGNSNVARSLALACSMGGAHITIASPSQYQPDTSLCNACTRANPHASLQYTEDVDLALKNAHVVYTDVWVSMGSEHEQEERRRAMTPYKVRQDSFRHTNERAIFLHCLPAMRGEEVDDAVIDGSRSKVWQQVANRKETIKALLGATLVPTIPFQFTL